ncbi:MAG TPA: DNA primase, partial [Gammaproteobacteria bacterium]|nr:DNA primase [Gammaproteobacteria bacterium]
QARDYLKERGLTGETAVTYSLGFAPQSWDSLINALTTQGVQKKDLQTAGLVSVNDNDRMYDKFRQRIIFPIHDQRGRVIAFGGRILGDGEPKYLNSPETPVFHKGKELYGLHLARDTIHKQDRVIVVEGYMDVIALAQAGITNAVASLGTATTADHIERLFRLCNEIIFCFDGDRAGRQAAWRALENTLPAMRDGKQAGFLFLPDGEDPDTHVRKLGKDAFLEQINTDSLPLTDYLLNHLSEDIDMSRLDGKARLAQLARPLLNSMPSGTLKAMMTDELARNTGLGSDQIDAILVEDEIKPAARPAPADHSAAKRSPHVTRALELLLHEPALAADSQHLDTLQCLELPGMDTLCQIIAIIVARPDIASSAIIERFRDTLYYNRLCELAGSAGIHDETKNEKEFHAVIGRLKLMAINQETGKLALAARSSTLSGDEKATLRKLYQEKRELERKLESS